MSTFRFSKLVGMLSLLALIVVGVMLTRLSKTQDEQTVKTVKIGAVYPLTGMFAAYGTEYQRGLEMAAEEINIRGGIDGKNIEVIFEDDGGDVQRSVSAARKLIEAERVRYLFTAFSSASFATAPIAEQNQVLYISATVSKIGTDNYIFRDFWDIEDQGFAIGKAIQREGIKRLGILAMNFGDTADFLKSVKNLAGDVRVREEKFNFGDSDFKTQLTKIKSFKHDAILLYAFPGAEAIAITKQIQELKLDDKRLFAGATTYDLPFMYEPFQGVLTKMKAIDTSYSPEDNNQKAKDFQAKYQERYKQELIGDAAYPYDDLYALKWAIETAGTTEDTQKIADTLRKIEYDGVAGKLTFDEKGNSKRKAYLQVFGENGWEKYEID